MVVGRSFEQVNERWDTAYLQCPRAKRRTIVGSGDGSRRDLLDFLARRGFVRAVTPVDFRKSDLWFNYHDDSSSAQRIVVLRGTCGGRAYQMDFGVACKSARVLMKSRLHLLPGFISSRIGIGDDLFVNLFSAGRALGWSLLAFPDVFRGTTGQAQLGELGTRIITPFLDATTDCQSVASLLFSKELAFEWSVANPVIRAYEILAIYRTIGGDSGSAVARLIELDSSLEASYRGGAVWSQIVQSLFDVLKLEPKSAM